MAGKERQASPGDFQLLGLQDRAPPDQVKKAYKAYVKTWHPDRFPQGSRQQRRAEERLKDANAAYRRIRNDWPVSFTANRSQAVRSAPPPSPPRPAPAVRPTRAPGLNLLYRLHHAGKHMPGSLGTFRATRGLRLGVLLLLFLAVLIKLEPPSPPDDRREAVPGPKPGVSPPVASIPSLLEAPPPTALPAAPTQAQPPSGGISRQQPPPREPEPPGQEKAYFSLGSTKAEVLRVQGKPAKVYGQTWVYGMSDVAFRDGRVWRYHNFDGGLKVQIVPSATSGGDDHPEWFTLGSTRDEVLRAQGTPTQVEGNKWSYGFSEVHFKDGVVVGFNNFFDNLRVAMAPSRNLDAGLGKGYFTIGSSQEEVLAIQGTPTIVQGNQWSYQLSDVLFVDGKVRIVNDFSGILKYAEPASLAER